MGRVDQAIQLERDWIAYRVARHFGVQTKRVTDVGAAGNSERLTVACDQHMPLEVRMTNLFYEFEAPTTHMSHALDLLTLFGFENNMLFYRGLVLAGQCPDCGHAFFATHISGRKQ